MFSKTSTLFLAEPELYVLMGTNEGVIFQFASTRASPSYTQAKDLLTAASSIMHFNGHLDIRNYAKV